MSDCVTIFTERSREEFPPAMLEPEGEMITAPIFTKEQNDIIVRYYHMQYLFC